MSSYEEEIVARHSTPGLRKNQLNRAAKKEHLNSAYKGLSQDDRDKILADLYPGETS